MTKKIVAIGGGDMSIGATAGIDEEIIRLAGKKSPVALLIPTAKSDDPEYFEKFNRIYGEKYGCRTRQLNLISNLESGTDIRKEIFGADIIYVEGGNTLKMMRRWRHLGVDKMIINAWKQGKVMAGTSAGAICWFQYGHSDSMAYYHPYNWNWIKVKCLGILPFIACPHVLAEGRLKHFQEMVLKTGLTGIALDDCSAVEVIDNRYRIISSRKNTKAFKLISLKNKLITEKLPQDGKFRDINNLSLLS